MRRIQVIRHWVYTLGSPNQETPAVMPTNIKKPAAIASILEAPFRADARIVATNARRANGPGKLSERVSDKNKTAVPHQFRIVMEMDVRPSALRHCGSSCRKPLFQPLCAKTASEGIATNMRIPRIFVCELSGILYASKSIFYAVVSRVIAEIP
jgi:hypothetical protein